jgi:hypothetical protein
LNRSRFFSRPTDGCYRFAEYDADVAIIHMTVPVIGEVEFDLIPRVSRRAVLVERILATA